MTEEAESNTLEPNNVILDKLRSEMFKIKPAKDIRPRQLDFDTTVLISEQTLRNESLNYTNSCHESEQVPTLDL